MNRISSDVSDNKVKLQKKIITTLIEIINKEMTYFNLIARHTITIPYFHFLWKFFTSIHVLKVKRQQKANKYKYINEASCYRYPYKPHEIMVGLTIIQNNNYSTI